MSTAPQQAFATLRYLARHPSPARNRLRAVWRFLRRQVAKRVAASGRSMFCRWQGLTFEVFPDSTSAAAVYYLDLPDWWEMNFMRRFLRPGDTVADVGANVGTYTLLAAALVGRGGDVVAFEPDPHNAKRLRAQVARNNLSWVDVHEQAVGEREGSVMLEAGHDALSNVSPAGARGLPVAMTTLDRFYADRRKPVWVKVDVEGYEEGVLHGAQELMATGVPLVWQLEIGVRATAYGFSDAGLASILRRHRYTLWRYDVRNTSLVPAGDDRAGSDNVLAVRDIELAAARLRVAEPGNGSRH